MASEAARTVEGVTLSVVLLSTLVTFAGVALIVGPGYLNPLRFAPYFIAVGTSCFFVPGVLGGVGGYWLRTERRGTPWWLATIGIALQGLVACAAFAIQFFFSPISAVPLIVAGVWAIASAVLLWRLFLLRGAVNSDATAHRGFVIESAEVSDR